MKRTTIYLFFALLSSASLFGQTYWQQEVNYNIQVKLNDKNHTLSAFEEFEYVNNSPNTLDKIYVHLWPNAYRNGNTALGKQKYKDGEKQLRFGKEEDKGGIDSLDFQSNGQKLKWEYDPVNIDICVITLPTPLKSGESIRISTPFKVKIPSGEIVNIPLLESVSRSNKRILLSTGMANVNEISNAIKILSTYYSKKRIILLPCVSEYPTNFCDVNLKSINFLRKKFNLEVGLSDHSLGTEVAIGAVALGAKFIEKHFTISKRMKGPDHIVSLEPGEFSSMVKQIRNIEQAMGKFEKRPNKRELATSFLVRQSLHAKIDIKKGEKFNLKNICLMRPNDGLPSSSLKKIIGCKADFFFNKYAPIK